MRILLITPVYRPEHIYGKLDIGLIIPPFGLLSISSYLTARGYDNEIIDCLAEGLSEFELLDRVTRLRPEIVGITCSTSIYNRALATARVIRSAAPECLIVFGGPHPTVDPEGVIAQEAVDLAVVGEGEESFLDICRWHRDGEPSLESSDGIVYQQEGRIIRNRPRAMINDLDSLPLPAWDKIDLRRYRLSPGCYKAKPYAPMLVSRGCPYQCFFCSNAIFGNRCRYRSVENVFREIYYLREEYQVRFIQFFDDVFTINRTRTVAFCERLLQERLGLQWCCETRVDLVDPELLTMMQQAGCTSIGYGIESGDEAMLRRINKKVTLEQIRCGVAWTRAAGIEVKAYFVPGLPGETQESLERTLRLARELRPDICQFTAAVPFPGTPFHDYVVREEGFANTNWDAYTLYAEGVYCPEGLHPKELSTFVRRAWRETYFNRDTIFRQIKSVRGPADVARLLRGLVLLLRFLLRRFA